MPKRAVEFFIIDILIAIDKIKRNMKIISDFNEFIKNENVFDATMRELEIIGEAVKYVLEDKNYSKLVSREWRKIVDFRNIVAHEYFGIDLDIVFEVATKKIIEFEKEVFLLISKIENKKVLFNAIEDAKKELEKMKRKKGLDYLNKIEAEIS